MTGLTVIRKCCERNKIYSLDERICIENQMLSTQFFDDLKSKEKNEIFFRIGWQLNCPYEQQTSAEFRLVSGKLQVRMNKESDWEEQLISAENYCLEDYVISVARSAGLPETGNMAKFCTNQTVSPAAEFSPAVDPINFKNLTAIDNEIQEEMEIPKCCLPGYVVEGETCQPLMIRDSETKVANALNQYLREYYNISSILISNASLSCGYGKSIFLLPMPESLIKLKFQLQAERNVSLSMHIYKSNDWDFELQLQNFCLDIHFFRNLGRVSSEPQVFYCAPPSTSVSIHYPILLYISAASLLATFIIYFIVPASGNS